MKTYWYITVVFVSLIFSSAHAQNVIEIRFLKNSTDLADRNSAFNLKLLIELIKDQGYAPFMIEGHASAEGSTEYNQSLSERRANAIYEYLVRQDIPKRRLSTAAYGESKARHADTASEYKLATDRRVLVYSTASGAPW